MIVHGAPLTRVPTATDCPPVRIGHRGRYDLHSRRRWAARRALIGLAYLLLLDGHLGEAEGGHTQEETPESTCRRGPRLCRTAGWPGWRTSERHERRERRDPGEEAHFSPLWVTVVALRDALEPDDGSLTHEFRVVLVRLRPPDECPDTVLPRGLLGQQVSRLWTALLSGVVRTASRSLVVLRPKTMRSSAEAWIGHSARGHHDCLDGSPHFASPF